MEPTSRYNYSVLYRDKGGDFWGTRPPVYLHPHATDQHHRVTDADSKRIDLIAWRYYRDISLWWVIAEVNGIGNPIEIKPGVVLRIPSYERIQMKVVR